MITNTFLRIKRVLKSKAIPSFLLVLHRPFLVKLAYYILCLKGYNSSPVFLRYLSVRAIERSISNNEKKMIYYIFGKKLLKSSTQSQSKAKYLFYYGENWAGIGHMFGNLQSVLREGLFLRRTVVLQKPRLTYRHNNKIPVFSSWSDYYDIKKICEKAKINFIDYEDFVQKSFARDEVLFVSEAQKITPEQNEKYTIIIRNLILRAIGNEMGGMIRKLKLVSTKQKLRIYVSQNIMQEVAQVREKLSDNYCAIHLRRTDRLKYTGKYTSVKSVLSFLKKHNPSRLPVFLMTDEPKKDFYKGLEKEYSIFRYYDFENLLKVEKKRNNYLLYLIEKQILEKAKISIKVRHFIEIKREGQLIEKQLVKKEFMRKARQLHTETKG